ncbi:MAG: hypothetical protein ABFS03_11650 [Chloroflexota bacterium]
MEKDIFDYTDPEPEGSKKKSGASVWNMLTAFVVLTAICVGAVFLTIFLNPQSGINPFPPPTMPARAIDNTATPTPLPLMPPTWTPGPSPTTEPTKTLAPLPTIAPLNEPTATPDEAASQPGDMPFVLHDGNPQYIPNLYHADLGCNWMGVGGQILSLNGAPVTGVVLKIGGKLDGKAVDIVTISGTATQYGPAGYEFDLTEIVSSATASKGSMWVQMLDQAGLPMSDQIYFDSFEDCEKSTIIIYFKQVR